MTTITFNNLEFKVYTDDKTHKTYSIVAHNEKHNLYYRGCINKYAGDLFEYEELYKYINELIGKGDIQFEIPHGHMNFIHWKIHYGNMYGKPLITKIEFYCKNRDLDNVDDIINRGGKCTTQMYDVSSELFYDAPISKDKELIKLLKKTQNSIRNLFYTAKSQDLWQAAKDVHYDLHDIRDDIRSMLKLAPSRKIYDIREGTVHILLSDDQYKEIEKHEDDSEDYELDA